MKVLISLIISLLFGFSFADGYCQTQKLYGFEDAEFLLGSTVPNNNPQAVVNELLDYASISLIKVDTFVTSITYYELSRVVKSNELILMTASEQHVCFYLVPTDEPTLQVEQVG